MKPEFANILNDEESILLFYEYFRNNTFDDREAFMDFLKMKTREKTDTIIRLNATIDREVFKAIDGMDGSADLIPEIMDLAQRLFQEDLGEQTVYLDIYLSREILVQLLDYFCREKDVEKELVCLYWLVRICTVLNDTGNAFAFYRKARRYLKEIDSLSETARISLLRIMINRTTFDWYNFAYFKAVIKYLTVNRDRLSIPEDRYNTWMFVLYNNWTDHSIQLIRSRKRPDEKLLSRTYEAAKNARMYQALVEGGDPITILTPLVLEAEYYHGDFADREEYHGRINAYLARLAESNASDSFTDTKEEIENSLKELYLFDIVTNDSIPMRRKVELMDERFEAMSNSFAKCRMTQEELELRKYIINYLVIATKVLSREDVVKNVLLILKHLHKFTFVHSIENASIAVALAEEIIYTEPEFFIGLPNIGTVKDVIDNKAGILNFVKYSGYSHDFGKIGIATVVSKLNKLTDYEFDMIKRHTNAGYKILSASEETIGYGYVALCHHKNFDFTSGYPTEIPEEAYAYRPVTNIITAADVISAATDVYGRTYSTVKYFPDVQREITEKAGTYFSPVVSRALNQESCAGKVRRLLDRTREDLLFRTFTNRDIGF